jgi:hypothetical protein
VAKSAAIEQMPVHEERLMSRPVAAEHNELAQSAARTLAAGADCGREGLNSLHEVWRRHVLSRDDLVIPSGWCLVEMCASTARDWCFEQCGLVVENVSRNRPSM